MDDAGLPAELLELLADEDRFTARYPRVADYLSLAPRLRGTGDDAADAAFDLRLLRYMTGDDPDPYWRIVAPLVTDRAGRRVADGGAENGSPRLAYAQTILQAAYAYAIPSPDTVEWIAARCAGRRLVEIGAGRGYWACQLARAGADIAAYDLQPPDDHDNPTFPPAPGQKDVWHPVAPLDQLSADPPTEADVLFLCWPPGWNNPMPATMLTDFHRAGGRDLLYIGEPPNGRTANPHFFTALTTHWTLKSQAPTHPTWPTQSDQTQWWTRTP